MKETVLRKKKVDKFEMLLDIDDGGISRVLYAAGVREKIFMSLIRNAVQPGMVCVDLGANIGYTTLFMLDRVGDEGFVYAIEPDKHNLDLLNRNISNNNFHENCEMSQCAISDKDGKLDFWIASKPNLNSVQKNKHSIRKETVDSFTLETFLEPRKYPNFIKMDVEGHEVKIFEGAYEYFKKNPGSTHILLEVHPQYYNDDNDFEAILEKYFDIGFKPKFVVSTPVPRPKKFVEAGYKPAIELPTDGFVRGLYNNISKQHLLEFSCRENIEGNSKKIVRSFMLSREQ